MQHLNQSSRLWSNTLRHSLNTTSQTEQQNLSMASRKREKSASYTDIQLHLLQIPLSVSKPEEIMETHLGLCNNTGYTTLASSKISTTRTAANLKCGAGSHVLTGCLKVLKSANDNEHLSSILKPAKCDERIHTNNSDNNSDSQREIFMHAGNK